MLNLNSKFVLLYKTGLLFLFKIYTYINMPKSKLTLIVDGNWLLMSRLSVLNNRYVDEYELNQELKLMLIKSINIVLHTFIDIDNIIFVADGGSWRNSIEVPDFLYKEKTSEDQSVEYKGNRVRSSDINWELLFNSYDDFIYKDTDDYVINYYNLLPRTKCFFAKTVVMEPSVQIWMEGSFLFSIF